MFLILDGKENHKFFSLSFSNAKAKLCNLSFALNSSDNYTFEIQSFSQHLGQNYAFSFTNFQNIKDIQTKDLGYFFEKDDRVYFFAKFNLRLTKTNNLTKYNEKQNLELGKAYFLYTKVKQIKILLESNDLKNSNFFEGDYLKLGNGILLDSFCTSLNLIDKAYSNPTEFLLPTNFKVVFESESQFEITNFSIILEILNLDNL